MKKTYVAFVTNRVSGKRYGTVTIISASRSKAARLVCCHLIDSGFTEPGTTFKLRTLRTGIVSCLLVP